MIEFVVAEEFHADHAGPDVYLLLASGAGEVVREPRGVPLGPWPLVADDGVPR